MLNLASLESMPRLGRRRRGGGAPPALTPAALFAGGEAGVWYEPGPTTAFKSTTDLTPCAAGDSCGFLLDQSKGAGYSGGAFTGLGTELVTNGTFDTDLTGWSNLINSSWDDGKLRCANGTFLQSSVFTGSKTVLISWDQTVNAGMRARLRLRNATGGADIGPFLYYFWSGPKSIVLTTTDGLSLWFFVETEDDITFDNISVRELPGNHAAQATAAARPLLQSGSPDYLRDDLVDDALNWTAPADTDYTIARLNSAGIVTILTGQSLSGATDILLEQDVAGYVAVDRALTSQETTDLAAYLEALT